MVIPTVSVGKQFTADSGIRYINKPRIQKREYPGYEVGVNKVSLV